MSKIDKSMAKLMDPRQENNIAFSDLCTLLRKLGYSMRIRGSHHVFTKASSTDIFTLQPIGSKAKGYQVRQVRATLLK